jgi:hypothetical protein
MPTALPLAPDRAGKHQEGHAGDVERDHQRGNLLQR